MRTIRIFSLLIILSVATLCKLSPPVPQDTATPKIATVMIDGTPPAPQPTAKTPPFAYEARPDGAQRISDPGRRSSDQNPATSPDGAHLVFTRFEQGYNNGPAGLFLLDMASGEARRLTPAEDQDNVNLPGSAWNAANGDIVFASDRQDANDLWRINPDGGGLQRLTRHGAEPWYLEPSWSPNGGWIVFESRQPGESEDDWVGETWLVKADGSGLKQLTGGPGLDDRQPNWSPDGKRILFQRRSLPDGQWDIYTIDPSGGELFNVTGTPEANETDASWSPSSLSMICSSDYGGLPFASLYIYPANGGTPHRLTASSDTEDGAPSWSPDGRWIVFESHPTDEDTPAALWWIATPVQYWGAIRR